MTIYNVPLSDSARASIYAIRSARRLLGCYRRTGDDHFMTLHWYQLFISVGAVE